MVTMDAASISSISASTTVALEAPWARTPNTEPSPKSSSTGGINHPQMLGFFFGLWHWLWHTLATYSYIKLTNLRYLSESIMVLSESHAHFGYNTGISSRFPAALLICFHWGSPPDPRDPSLPWWPWWPWWPGDPSGKSRLWPWLISWWLPGLVNIQKAIENGYLWCIFPLIAWWFSSSLCKRLPEGKPAKRNHNIAERAAGRHRKNEWRFHQQNLADFTNRKVDSREQN